MEQTLRVQEGLAGLSSAVQENISGIHVVKAYAAEDDRGRALRAPQRRVHPPERRAGARARPPDAADAASPPASARWWCSGTAARRSSTAASASATWWRSSATSTFSPGRRWRSAGCCRSCSAAARRCSRLEHIFAHGAGDRRRRRRRRRCRRCAARSSSATSRSPIPAADNGHPVVDDRLVHARAGTEARHRRPHRRRQELARAAAAAAVRCQRRRRAARRARRAHAAAGTAAPRHRLRAAGSVPVLAPHPRQHRLRPRRGGSRTTIRARRRGGRRRRRHRGVPARLRHGRRRARHHAVGRPEAAPDAWRAPSPPRRASWCSTTRCRASTRAPSTPSCSSLRERDGGPHQHRHRPPRLDGHGRRPHRRDRRGSHRRVRRPRRAAGARRRSTPSSSASSSSKRRSRRCDRSALPAGADLHREAELGKAYDARLIRRLWAYIRPYRRIFWAAMLCLPLTSACSLAQPYLLKIAIDRYIAPGRPQRPAAHRRALRPRDGGRVRLPLPAVLPDDAGGAAAASPPCASTSSRICSSCRRAFFDRNPVGRLVTRLTTDVDVINEMFAAGALTILMDVATLLGIVAHHAGHRLAPGAGHPGGGAVRGRGDQLLPRQGAAELPPHSRPPGAPERLSAGSAGRDDGDPAVRARARAVERASTR